MENMVNIYLFGKLYSVPSELTIMRAMEYSGYQLVRGCGCRNGFCGACATIYRIKGHSELKACLACQTKVEEAMYIATLPFFPLVKQVYDIEKVPVDQQVMMQRPHQRRIRGWLEIRQRNRFPAQHLHSAILPQI